MLILCVTAIYILGYRASWFLSEAAQADRTPPPLIDETRRLEIQPVLDQLDGPLAAIGGRAERVLPARQEGDVNELHFEVTPGPRLVFEMDPYSGDLTLARGEIPPGVRLDIAYDTPPPPAETENAGKQPFAGRLAEWMLQLHTDLFLGVSGLVIVGCVGVLFLISTLSGLIIYAPFMKAFAFGQLRKKKWRFLLADAHKLVGITSLVFNLVIALSGIGLTFGVLAIPGHMSSQIEGLEARTAPGGPTPSFDEVMAAARAARAEAYLFELVFPDPERHPDHFIAHSASQPGWPDLAPLLASVENSSPPKADSIPRPWWVWATVLGAPMHYGNFGGMWTRLVYLALTIATAMLSLSGFALYFMRPAKNTKRGSP